MLLGSALRGAVEDGLASPLRGPEKLFNCFDAGIDRVVDLGWSGTLLDKILENDIGSAVLVVFVSSGGFMTFGGLSSSMVPCDDGRSIEPLARDV